MPGEAMLRVENVRDEAVMESIRDALDRLGVDYEHAPPRPGGDRFPQAAYDYGPDDSAEDGEGGLADPSEEHGFDAGVLWGPGRGVGRTGCQGSPRARRMSEGRSIDGLRVERA